VKLNRKVPFVMSELAANGQQQKGKDGRQFEPIPPYKAKMLIPRSNSTNGRPWMIA